MDHVVTDPALVREVLGRPEDFLPSNALTSVVELTSETLRTLTRARFALPPVLASATGHAHRHVRRVVAASFSPARVDTVRGRVAELTAARCSVAAEALAREPRSGVDLADLVTRHVPPVVLGELLGLRMPDTDRLRRWSRHSLELFWGRPDGERQRVLAASAAAFFTWLRAEIRDPAPTASPHGVPLFSALADVGLGEAQLCSLGYFLLIAGQETTSMLIDIAVHRALREPGRWAELTDERAAGLLVRDVLTDTSPVPTWRRVAARDTSLGGETILAGAELLLELTGHWPVDAPPTAYALAFGHGVHRCLGARLAELEATVAVAEIARALPGLVPAGPEPEWLSLLSFQAPLAVRARRGT